MTTLVVFDVDGTLFDSAPLHQAAFLAALHGCGLPDVDTRWDRYEHHTDSWIFAEVFRANRGRGPTPADRAAFAHSLRCEFAARLDGRPLRDIPGAPGLVRDLLAAPGHAVAFATGGMRGISLDKLALLGVDADIDALTTTASEHAFREHIVLDAISRAGSAHGVERFDRVVSVGDGRWDALTAQRLGVEFVGIAAEAGRFGGLCPVANVVPTLECLDLERCYPLPAQPDPERWARWSPAGCACLG